MPSPPAAMRPARPGGLMLLRALAVLLPLVALAANGVSAWEAVEQSARGRVERVADMLHEHALRAFEAQELAIAAVEQRLRGLDWAAVPGDEALYGFLRALDSVNPAFGGLALVDPRGQLVMSSARPFGAPPRDVTFRDYVAALPAGRMMTHAPFIGQVMLHEPGPRPMFPMARPRRPLPAVLPRQIPPPVRPCQLAQGEQAAPGPADLSDGGIILASLWPENLVSFYRSILETEQDAVTLFRLDGALLASVPPPAQPEGAALPREAGRVLHQLRHGAAVSLAWASPFDGEPRLTAFRRLSGYDAGVAYGLARHALGRDWRRRMVGPLVGAMLAMLVLGAATWQAERALRARAAAEARSRAAERQATLGLLAGGLAHDFGNITQSVAAAAQLLSRHAENPARVRQVALHLQRHAERATALARRLLETTRRTSPAARGTAPVPVAEPLREVCALLDATLGAGIRVVCEVPPGLHAAPGLDRAELETALINLAANARDAMPQGGEVRVSAEQVQVPPRLAELPGLPPGAYLRITVRDTGHGMAPEVLARLGEPLFTTKPEGQGTGLGLAMVGAFLRGVGGGMAAQSAPGHGSAIHMLLPSA
ncbi:ATP-binding protein [Falsiroseomonas selenitidurans]|uniref:histidine kinase n=1 Tax=Falsiroseomonas selenitidurans TaxID=2716335 RepID=A0ABX1DZ44_9PROT|nr:hybrid sensor histidine kinase/response regulator [Falsiroseomonas selenitidurans]NKC30138.1 hypothetical protein [Falsiroseomonas selenitidurans]